MRSLFFMLCLLSISWMFIRCQADDSFEPIRQTDNDGTNPTNVLDNRGLPTIIIDPNDNVTSLAKKELGRLLFYDPILSGNEDVSCATCHHPDFGYADGRDLPIGVGGIGLGPNRVDGTNGDIPVVGRNSPTVLNTAYNGINNNGNVNPNTAPMFWDNRANGLEEQAVLPSRSFNEMRGHAYEEQATWDVLEQRLQNIPEYVDLFEDVFGDNSISELNIGRALSAFERSLVANNSPFDQYARGNANALNQQQLRGLQAFDRAGCDDCHSGPMFSDYQLHVLGTLDNNALGESDSGANGTFAFRTPTLRNISQTAPYFHGGVEGNLNDVLQFYRRAQNAGGGGGNNGGINPNVNPNQLDNDLRNLNLNNNDINDIVAFLNSLTDNDFDRTIPNSVPSGLPVGGL